MGQAVRPGAEGLHGQEGGDARLVARNVRERPTRASCARPVGPPPPGPARGPRPGPGRARVPRPRRRRPAGRRHRRGGLAADGSAGVRAGSDARFSRPASSARACEAARNSRSSGVGSASSPAPLRGALEPGAAVELAVGRPSASHPAADAARCRTSCCSSTLSSSHDRSRGQARASASCASSNDPWSVMTSRARASGPGPGGARGRPRQRTPAARAHRFTGIARLTIRNMRRRSCTRSASDRLSYRRSADAATAPRSPPEST